MTKQGPNEKTIETLFISYAIAHLKFKKRFHNFHFYAPTTVEEAKLGYDASFVGSDEFSEVYLQFKRVYLESEKCFGIKFNARQHEILVNLANRGYAAYYVAAAFRTQDEANTVQRIDFRNPCDFLKNYIVMPVKEIPKDAICGRFQRKDFEEHWWRPIGAEYSNDCTKYFSLKTSSYTGCYLLTDFQQGKIGTRIVLAPKDIYAKTHSNENSISVGELLSLWDSPDEKAILMRSD